MPRRIRGCRIARFRRTAHHFIRHTDMNGHPHPPSLVRDDTSCAVECRPFNRCTTRSRKIFQFKHYCTDAPI